MAINPLTLYTGKVASDPTNYPYGKARNVTVSGDGTGTPWEAALVNDIFGFQQRLLDLAGITPSGTPDSAVTSQYFEAVWALGNQRSVTHDMASDADYTLSADQNLYERVIITDSGVLLTAPRNIVVDDVVRQIIVQNLTAQVLTFKTALGTGVAVPVGGFRILRNDGTNVVEAGASTGFKNLIVNPRKTIQQRGTTGGRRQVIDKDDILITGPHTISFTGTATVQIYEATTLGANDAGTTWVELTSGASTSGTTVTLTAGKYVKVEFSTTVFDNVQLERGSVATSEEIRLKDLELTLCQGYYEILDFTGTVRRWAGSAVAGYEAGEQAFAVAKRRIPNVTTDTPTYTNCSTLTATRVTTSGLCFTVTALSIAVYVVTFTAFADAEHFSDTYFEDRWF